MISKSEQDNLPNSSNLAARSQWLASQLSILRNSLRTGQQGLATWQGGEMAVSAVPGAGKSHSLSVAAAIALYEVFRQRQ